MQVFLIGGINPSRLIQTQKYLVTLSLAYFYFSPFLYLCKMKCYDYIITGGGAAGLMLAYRLAKDSFFDQKSILILDSIERNADDRTWSFGKWVWENGIA